MWYGAELAQEEQRAARPSRHALADYSAFARLLELRVAARELEDEVEESLRFGVAEFGVEFGGGERRHEVALFGHAREELRRRELEERDELSEDVFVVRPVDECVVQDDVARPNVADAARGENRKSVDALGDNG